MKKSIAYSPEVMERAVRMVFEAKEHYESQWAAIVSISAKIGCTAETLLRWGRQHERDTGQREGLSTAEQERIKVLEREVRELRKANGAGRPISRSMGLTRSGTNRGARGIR